MAHRRDAELSVGGGNTGDQFHCVRPRVIPHLKDRQNHFVCFLIFTYITFQKSGLAIQLSADISR